MEEYMEDVKTLVGKLTLEEKVHLLSGKTFWTTYPVERLGIPSVKMTDGPHGTREEIEGQHHQRDERQRSFDLFPLSCRLRQFVGQKPRLRMCKSNRTGSGDARRMHGARTRHEYQTFPPLRQEFCIFFGRPISFGTNGFRVH